MNGGLVLLSLSGQTVWQRPKARVHTVTEPWPSVSILSFSFFPLLLPLPPLSPSVIHFSFFNFLLSRTFISVFIFSASPRLLFSFSLFFILFVSLCPLFLAEQLQNWEHVYVNHTKAKAVVCVPPSLPSLTHFVTLCLCSLKLNFAMFLAAFESLVEGRQWPPQAFFSAPLFSFFFLTSLPHTQTHAPWQLCCFGGVGLID